MAFYLTFDTCRSEELQVTTICKQEMVKIRKYNTNCSVYGCHSKYGRERNLSFHLFPRKNVRLVSITNKFNVIERIDRKLAWERVLLRATPASTALHVCSLHFKREDFILPAVRSSRPRLKCDAVPSRNLPTRPSDNMPKATSKRTTKRLREETPPHVLDNNEEPVVACQEDDDHPRCSRTDTKLVTEDEQTNQVIMEIKSEVLETLLDVPEGSIEIKTEEFEHVDIKTEELEHVEIKLEDLHHSIDIKEDANEGEIAPSKSSSLNLFECDICDDKFRQATHLKLHMFTHQGGKPYECELCNGKFSTRSMLTVHLTTHTGVKPFNCTICDFSATFPSKLKAHVMYTHIGKKPFTCEFCDYQCVYKGALENHLRIHTGDKPFSCQLCDYNSSRAQSLKVHMFTHTGEKPFWCALCDYKSSRKASLILHLSVHTGRKPYGCEFCDYKCTRKSQLTKHLNSHTK